MYLYFFTLVVFLLLSWGAYRRGRIYQFPFLAGVAFFGFMLLQLVGLQKDPSLPPGAFERVSLMALLCAVALFVGYKIPRRPTQLFRWDLNRDRLFRAALLLVVFGALFSFLMNRAAESVTGSQWSGPVVIFHFLRQTMDYGFVIAVLLYARTGSKRSLVLSLFCSLFYFDAIFIAARRATAAKVILAGLLALWFHRRKSIPRWIFIPLIAAAMVIGSTSITEYRIATNSEEAVRNIPWQENIEQTLEQGGQEMRASAYQMAAIEEVGLYDYGSFHWNRLVFNYIPAQLLGNSFKESLYIPTTEDYRSGRSIERNDITYRLYGYEKGPGITVSGVTDAFASFWYFGFIKFLVVGAIMKVLYVSSMRGNWTCQILYILLIVPSMHIVTHNTHWFFADWLLMAVFLGPAFMYARRSPLLMSKQSVHHASR